jgi:cytochrome b subunit of formate dehydrogenase
VVKTLIQGNSAYDGRLPARCHLIRINYNSPAMSYDTARTPHRAGAGMTAIQKFIFVIAVLSYVAAAGTGVAAYLHVGPANDPIEAALMASVVFFAGCGVVLHVIATTRLKGLLTPQKPD